MSDFNANHKAATRSIIATCTIKGAPYVGPGHVKTSDHRHPSASYPPYFNGPVKFRSGQVDPNFFDVGLDLSAAFKE